MGLAAGPAPTLFDAHCHLQDERLLGSTPGVVGRALGAGVTRMSCCGSSEQDWASVLELSASYSSLVPSLGLHPWYVSQRAPEWFSRLEDLVAANPVGVGEVGLDHALDRRNDAEQYSVFVQQVRLAKRLGRPLSIHCRKAWEALLAALAEVKGIRECGGLIHSYSGPPDLVARLESLGCRISFSGSITRPNNKRGRASLLLVSPGGLLIETDSPDMSPLGVAGPDNEPANLVLVLRCVAGLLGIPEQEAADLTRRNAESVFGSVQRS